MGGLGSFSAIELRKVLTGKVASARPFISALDEGLSGSASPKDLETLFQLIYLCFMQPRADPTIFGVMTSQTKALLANQQAEPEFVFFDMLRTTLSQNHLRARSMTPELVDRMDLDKSFAFYKDRFADASDFTFVFVGTFDEATLRPLVERYLGALPSLRRKETWRDVGIMPPTGIVERRVAKGIEPKSLATLVFTGPFKYDQTERVAIRALADVLETRLRETLREDLGGTYSVSAIAGYSRYPRAEYSFSIEFGSNPSRTEALVKTVLQEIDRLKASGPTEQQASDVRETFLRDFETNIKQNGYLLNQIALKYQYGEPPESLLDVPEYYKKLTPAAIQQAARTYLDTNNYVKVTLFPEK
jgi:zinc protease